jgi:AcrR family transcriptional regulator
MAYRRTGVGEAKREASIGKIVAAAEKLFVEKGFEGTTMQDIVREAGSSIGNVYFYFKNKQDLLRHLVVEGLEEGYRIGDELAVKAPRGPARLAVMLLCNAQRIWGPEANTSTLMRHLGDQPFADDVLRRNNERVKSFLIDNIPTLSEAELDYASAAWTSSSVGIAAVFAREPADTRSMWRAAEFVVRWNLRACNIPNPEIDQAIATARSIMEA